MLLEAGGWADADYWKSLPADLVRETGATGVAYGRAGYGESDLPDTPYDVRQEIAGLWRGLKQLDLAHSLIAAGRAMPVPRRIPVRVITAGIPWWSTPDEDRAWRALHEHLAAAVDDGKLWVADKSAHLIPYDQPEILIAAVAELVMTVSESNVH